MGQTHKNSEFHHKFLWKHYIHHSKPSLISLSPRTFALSQTFPLAAFVSLYTCSQFQHQSWEIYREIMTPAWACGKLVGKDGVQFAYTWSWGSISSSSNQRTVSRSRDLSSPITVLRPRGQFSGCKLAMHLAGKKCFGQKQDEVFLGSVFLMKLENWEKLRIAWIFEPERRRIEGCLDPFVVSKIQIVNQFV